MNINIVSLITANKCTYCDQAYRQKGDLNRHLAKMHLGDNIYQCDKCEKGFRLQIELRKHSYEHYKNEKMSHNVDQPATN